MTETHRHPETDRRTTPGLPAPHAFRWTPDQSGGPGPEPLGELRGSILCDLGSGTARNAAYLAVRYPVHRIDAVETSPTQHAQAINAYAQLAPRLRLLCTDAVSHLRRSPASYDTIYSVFGAVDFTEPRLLLPVAARSLRLGGQLVFSTLAHDPARMPAQEAHGNHRRRILPGHVWARLLHQAGFDDVKARILPATGKKHSPRTRLVTATLSRQ